MKSWSRIAAIPLAALVIGAGQAATSIPLGTYDEAVVIPAKSPLKFQHFDSNDSAHFIGRLLIEGVSMIDCWDCEPGIKGTKLHLSVVPDPAIAAELPHWKKHDNDIAIDVTDAEPVIRTLVTPAQRRLLLSGKLDEVRGRTAIIVDRYTASLDCDSADYSAHFVAVAKQARLADLKTNGSYGCGFI